MQLRSVYSYNNNQYLLFIVVLGLHSRKGDTFSIYAAVKTSHLNVLFYNSGFRSARVSLNIKTFTTENPSATAVTV